MNQPETVVEEEPVATEEETEEKEEEESTQTQDESETEEGKEKEDKKKKSPTDNHDFRRMKKFISEAAAQRQRADMLQQQLDAFSQQQQTQEQSSRPTRVDYPDPADYADALANWQDAKHASELEAIRSEREMTPLKASFAQQIPTVKAKYEDYDDVMDEAKSMPVTPELASAILVSPVGAELQYFLAKHPDEFESITRLPERAMLMKIGELSATLKSSAKKSGTPMSGAPAPVKPVGARGSGGAKKPEEMTMAEWAKWDEEHGYTARRRKGRV